MSKERARRRAEREAAQAVATAKRVRRELRRARRRALARRFRPRPGRRASLLGRRSPGERAFILGLALATLGLIWYLVPSLTLRIAFTLILVLVLPVVVTMGFDRKA